MLSDLIRQFCTLSSEATALDFGCGTHGSVSMNLCPEVGRVVGVDRNEKAVREFNKKCNFQGLDTEEISAIVAEDFWKDSRWLKTFNIIVASLVFHHLTDHMAICTRLRTVAAYSAQLVIVDLEKKPGINGIDPQELVTNVVSAGWSDVAKFDGPKIRLASGKRTNLFIVVAYNI